MVLQGCAFSSLVGLAFLTGALAACPCAYQGVPIPSSIYSAFPDKEPADCMEGTQNPENCTKYPGMHASLAGATIYGSTCAAWDQMPGTPWYSSNSERYSSCSGSRDWGHGNFNWCQQPWCYVDAGCADGVASSVYTGSSIAYYSYKSCGNAADCYTDIAGNASWVASDASDGMFPWEGVWPAGCPYDPTGGATYKVHKSGTCACAFQGQHIPASIYDNYPTATPGRYQNYPGIKFYGSTCASWDQVSGTPWKSSCPTNADWCHYDNNWCQEPWCYVQSSCATAVASSVFAGSAMATYSYDTCLSTPDCYTGTPWCAPSSPPGNCPFDSSHNDWYTAQQCAGGWTISGTNCTNGTNGSNSTIDSGSVPTTTKQLNALVSAAPTTGPSMMLTFIASTAVLLIIRS